MKTLYDKLPSGLETEDRAKVNSMMNLKKFSGSKLRHYHYHYYLNLNWFKRLRYPFVDWLWDQGVKKIQGNNSALDDNG